MLLLACKLRWPSTAAPCPIAFPLLILPTHGRLNPLPTAPPPLPSPQRKRLEPFEVPKSGAFWLHDDRFEAGEEEGGGGMRSEQVEGELDERQK